jgi:hypothetical protein
MATIPQTTVIVAVMDSMAGLRAIREAVAQARIRGARLTAISSYPEPRLDSAPYHELAIKYQMRGIALYDADSIAHEQISQSRHIAEHKAIDEMREKFDAAVGGVPRDIPVQMLATTDRLHASLISHVHGDDDLIV